jgi:hypothetical protein
LAGRIITAMTASDQLYASILVDPTVDHSGLALWDSLGFATVTKGIVYRLDL